MLVGQNPEMQLTELREYAARRGWQVVGEFVDRTSGAKEQRPALNLLMADARQRKFDVIAVWKLDRFGRSLRHLVNAIAEFEALGVAFISLRDNLDLGAPAGRLMFQIIGAMAEFERALIRERVRAGLQNASAERQAAWATWRCRRSRQNSCFALPVRPGARSRRRWASGSAPCTRPSGSVQETCLRARLQVADSGWPDRARKPVNKHLICERTDAQ